MIFMTFASSCRLTSFGSGWFGCCHGCEIEMMFRPPPGSLLSVSRSINASFGRSCRRTIVPPSSPSAMIKRMSMSFTGLTPCSGSTCNALSKAVPP